MRRFARRSLAIIFLPTVTGCFTITQVPVPATPPERERMEVHGVVVRQDDGTEERIDFEVLHEASWTSDGYSVVADVDHGGPEAETVTRFFPFATMVGVLTRQLDPGRSSGLIGGIFVVVAAIGGIAFSGTAGY